jgi:hypothetical protein
MWDSIFTNSLSQSFRGLSVQTHPDADKAAAQVRLVHADAIVMNDGQEIATWDNLDASLAASGAGGLDTGTEQASTWYQVHAIYNGTTKNIMFHRAKDYFFDQDITAGEDGAVALRDAAARTRIAQGFKTTNAGLCEFVDVKVFKTNSPTGNFWFTIEATSGGVPSGTPLATSDKYEVSLLTATPGLIRMPFRIPASLSAATQYHLVAYGDFTISATNFMSWRADTTAAAYANGSKATWDGATWTNDTSADFTCKIYITRNDTAVTMPSGYTQRALIGYAYNNSGSNLKHFWQKDRLTYCGGDDNDWQIGTLAGTTPFLVDLFAFVPPVNNKLSLSIYNATASHCGMGVLSCIGITATSASERIGQSIVVVTSSGYYVTTPPMVFDAYQGMMHIVAAGSTQPYVAAFEW